MGIAVGVDVGTGVEVGGDVAVGRGANVGVVVGTDVGTTVAVGVGVAVGRSVGLVGGERFGVDVGGLVAVASTVGMSVEVGLGRGVPWIVGGVAVTQPATTTNKTQHMASVLPVKFRAAPAPRALIMGPFQNGFTSASTLHIRRRMMFNFGL